jgi:hypothetical protein
LARPALLPASRLSFGSLHAFPKDLTSNLLREWFLWLFWFLWFFWFNQRNQTNEKTVPLAY